MKKTTLSLVIASIASALGILVAVGGVMLFVESTKTDIAAYKNYLTTSGSACFVYLIAIFAITIYGFTLNKQEGTYIRVCQSSTLASSFIILCEGVVCVAALVRALSTSGVQAFYFVIAGVATATTLIGGVIQLFSIFDKVSPKNSKLLEIVGGIVGLVGFGFLCSSITWESIIRGIVIIAATALVAVNLVFAFIPEKYFKK